jgi:dsDNA-specific endonuclease/ATPase MutS2
MADTSTSSQYVSMEEIKQELTKKAYAKDATIVNEIRTEIAKTVFEARKQLIVKQKDIFNKRDEFVQSIDKVWRKNPGCFLNSEIFGCSSGRLLSIDLDLTTSVLLSVIF